MSHDHHREDEARWVEAMRQRHARGQEYVCELADVMQTLEERDEARAEVERLRSERDEAREHTSTAAFMRVERQRDEARAEVERLRAGLASLLEASRPALRVLDKLGVDEWSAFDDAVTVAQRMLVKVER